MFSEDDQYDTVFTKGKFIEVVTEGETQYVLYAVSMFWVAVTSNASINKKLKCAPFVHGNSLVITITYQSDYKMKSSPIKDF